MSYQNWVAGLALLELALAGRHYAVGYLMNFWLTFESKVECN
jgi:hypothetical protein